MIQTTNGAIGYPLDLPNETISTTQIDVSLTDIAARRAWETDDAQAVRDAAKSLKRLERQADSTLGRIGYQILGEVYEFGRNIIDQCEGEPFRAVKEDLDRSLAQTDSMIAKIGIGAVGAFYGFGSTVFKLPSDLVQGVVEFFADPFGTISSIPAFALHNSQEIISGIGNIWDGNISKGTARFTTGVSGQWMLFEGGRITFKAAPAMYNAYANGMNKLLDIARPQVPDTPFNRWMRTSAPGFSRGAIEIPSDFCLIPGGEFKGQPLSPFAIKAKPTTNAEWLQGIEGQKRVVTLKFDPGSDVIAIQDISSQPPTSLSPTINLDTGRIVIEGSQVLLKLVDNPSAFYDVGGRVFSGSTQPVINVTKFHVLTWLQVQKLWRAGDRVYRLPTDLQFEFVATEGGIKKYATENGELYAADGRRLAHFDDRTTIGVDASRYEQQLPFGVQAIGNVWRWTEFNPLEECPHGIRAGSWSVFDPAQMRATFRNDYNSNFRYYDVGFQPVVIDVGVK